ncbi:MAG: heparinase, partial [Prevotella sp.]|nr:heparinase [Prevotella sp.]
MRKVFTFCLLFVCLVVHAYKERNLLQKAADPAKLKNVLITDQKWVRYPQYTDRNGWDQLMGENKSFFIG